MPEEENNMKLGMLYLPDLYETPNNGNNVTATSEATLDGGFVTFAEENRCGKSIDLVGYENSGWITYAQLKALENMSKGPTSTYTLDKNGEQRLVRFRHEEAPVLEFMPVAQRAGYDDSDYFYGTIKLIEVK